MNHSIPVGPMRGAERDRFLHAMRLLARPALSPSAGVELRALVDRREWRPLEPTSGMAPLLGLFRAHAATAGIEPQRLLVDGSSTQHAPGRLAVEYFRRRQVVRSLLEGFAAHGVNRVVLLKGVVLCESYPSPALRRMGDVDLAVSRQQVGAARRALHAKGWRGVGASWSHPSGLGLDLLVPERPLARALWRAALPWNPGWCDVAAACAPAPAAHLAYIAAQCAKNGGTRVWRDAVDVLAVVEASADASTLLEEAFAFARSNGCGAELAALLAFVARHAPGDSALPTRIALEPGERARARECLACYRAVSLDRLPPPAWDVVAVPALSIRDLARRAMSFAFGARRNAPVAGAPREWDAQLGDMGAARSWTRQWNKARILLRIARTGNWGHYRPLARQWRRIRSIGPVFSPAEEVPHP